MPSSPAALSAFLLSVAFSFTHLAETPATDLPVPSSLAVLDQSDVPFVATSSRRRISSAVVQG